MQSLFGLELSTAQKVIVASVVILVLLALLGLFVRQIQGGRLRLRGQAGGRQRQPRLGVVDTYDLDRQRQLVLIRRDNIEHLLMIGGASDVVVETNIQRSGSRAAPPTYVDPAADRPLPPFESLVPPSEPAMRAGDEARRAGLPEGPELLPPLPSRTVPVQAEPPLTGAAATVATAGVAAALGVAAAESVAAAAKPVAPPMPVPPLTTGPAPSFAREHAPQPAVSAGELDDMTRQLEEALKRPFSAVRPANLGTDAAPEVAVPAVEPPLVTEKLAPAPVFEEKAPPVKAAPIVEPQALEPEIVVTPAPVVPPRQKPIPSDVEAELAAALGLSLDRPIQKAPEPKPFEPNPVEMAQPEPTPAPEPVLEDEPIIEDEETIAIVEEPAPVEASKPQPESEKPAEPAAKEIDPFSVDAIEAEFARLLGRDPKAKS